MAIFPAVFAEQAWQDFAKDMRERFAYTNTAALNRPGLAGFLADALVNTRRMDVLEREKLQSVIQERDINVSSQVYSDVTKIASAGQVLNADFVVLPEIQFLRVIQEETGPAYIERKRQVQKARLGLNMRTVEVKTSRIARSEIYELVVTNRAPAPKGDLGAPALDFINSVYREAAVKEAARLIDLAYPIRLLAPAGELWVLNRGRGALQPGEVLDIYKQGERLIDPDTKEQLGSVEQRIGQVQVTEVDERTSLAQVIESLEPFQRANLARRRPEAR